MPSTYKTHMTHSLILYSGGLDSLALLAMAHAAGDTCTAVSFDYGQRHAQELQAAAEITAHYGVPHLVVKLDPTVFKDGPLLGSQPLAANRSLEEIATGISPQYMPARNTIFIAYAIGLAEQHQADRILFGGTAEDSTFPDCTPDYIEAWQPVAALATKCGREGKPVTVEAPLKAMRKEQVVETVVRLNAPIHLTSTCYQPPKSSDGTRLHCGVCDACVVRRKGFACANVSDPTLYVQPH